MTQLDYISGMDGSLPKAIPFLDVPSDVLLEVFVYLNVKEILGLQRVRWRCDACDAPLTQHDLARYLGDPCRLARHFGRWQARMQSGMG